MGFLVEYSTNAKHVSICYLIKFYYIFTPYQHRKVCLLSRSLQFLF